MSTLAAFVLSVVLGPAAFPVERPAVYAFEVERVLPREAFPEPAEDGNGLRSVVVDDRGRVNVWTFAEDSSLTGYEVYRAEGDDEPVLKARVTRHEATPLGRLPAEVVVTDGDVTATVRLIDASAADASLRVVWPAESTVQSTATGRNYRFAQPQVVPEDAFGG